MWRRVRGLAGVMFLWMVPWALAGGALGLVLRIEGGYRYTRVETYLSLHEWLVWTGGPIGFLAIAGALAGATAGLLFAIGIMAAHRRQVDLMRIPLWRFGAIGALAAASVAAMLYMPLPFVAGAATLGAFGGAAYLAVGRRGERCALTSRSQSLVRGVKPQSEAVR